MPDSCPHRGNGSRWYRSRRPRRRPSTVAPSWLTWKTVEVDGASAAYGEAGSASRWSSSTAGGSTTRRTSGRWPARGRRVRVLAPALPGFGGSAASRATSELGFRPLAGRFLEAVGVQDAGGGHGPLLRRWGGHPLAHDHRDQVRGLVLINSIGASAWAKPATLRSMAQRPLWDWGIHFPADLWPLRQARRVLPVIVAEALPTLPRPASFVRGRRWPPCRSHGRARRAEAPSAPGRGLVGQPGPAGHP